MMPPADRMRDIHCTHVLAAADAPAGGPQAIRIDGDRIAQIGASAEHAEPVLALPALVNAHDHGRAVRSSSFGAGGKPLETWLQYLALLPAVDPYLAAAVSLARSALGGCGAVMVHYTRAQGLTDLPTEAAEVARAARDVGVRVGFAVALRDRNPLVYGPSEPILAALEPAVRDEIARRFLGPPMPVAEQIALVDAVVAATKVAAPAATKVIAAAATATVGPSFEVQYGPAGVQWCTRELLEAVAEAAHRTGRRIHMHLLETRYQRAWADATFPHGIVRHLDEVGLLSPLLTLAHCTWARADELELIAARGATIAVNTSSNLGLRSGVAPLAEMVRRDCRVAFGLDGLALDEDDDALREMRLSHLLHGGVGFRVDVDRSAILEMAFRNGRRSVLNADDGGTLAAGQPADILLLDWHALDDDRLREDLDPRDLLFARAAARHIREVIVAGRTVVRDGQVTGIDFAAMRGELLARLRSGLAQSATFPAALAGLERAIRAHFASEPPCC